MMTLEEYEKLEPKTELNFSDRTKIIFYTPSIMTKWRVDSIYEKEPITLEWLSTLSKDKILLDIGANVGMYSIIAAKVYGAKVYSFEPEPINYSILTKNILLNSLSERINSYPAGISNLDGFSEFYVQDTRVGGSNNTMNNPINFKLEQMNYQYKVTCISYKLDTLIENGLIETPTHIKIDVDGIEHIIVQNGTKVLESDKLETLIIEINPSLKEHQGMIDLLGTHGFKFDQNQVNNSARKDGPFKGMAEYVFRR